MYYNGCFFTKNPSQALSGTSEVDKVVSLHGGRPCVKSSAFLALLCKAIAFEKGNVHPAIGSMLNAAGKAM